MPSADASECVDACPYQCRATRCEKDFQLRLCVHGGLRMRAGPCGLLGGPAKTACCLAGEIGQWSEGTSAGVQERPFQQGPVAFSHATSEAEPVDGMTTSAAAKLRNELCVQEVEPLCAIRIHRDFTRVRTASRVQSLDFCDVIWSWATERSLSQLHPSPSQHEAHPRHSPRFCHVRKISRHHLLDRPRIFCLVHPLFPDTSVWSTRDRHATKTGAANALFVRGIHHGTSVIAQSEANASSQG
mmetsp:Transcript_7467/g.20464  ORF Transcript_7467/g.20464 Transcript_7467/m.20464 type:complete len:243 (+) Transcript_7467:287-1015(+)